MVLGRLVFKLFLCCISVQGVAQVPEGLLSVEKIYEEIQLPIANKILQMQQNYVETQFDTVTTYTSREAVSCQTGRTVQPGMPILRVVTESQLLPYRREVKSYSGCNQNLSFREELIDSPDEYRYQLFGPDNESIFNLFTIKLPTEKHSEIHLTNERVYLIQEKLNNGNKEFFYYKFPFRLNFDVNGFNINFNNTTERNGYYFVRERANGILEIFSPQGVRVSKAEFIRNNGFSGINFFIEAILKDLPETRFISSGNRNQKLINELRNAQTFLLSNTNINYVRNLINEYIKLAEDGDLQDNR